MFKSTEEYDLAKKEILVRIRDGQPFDDLLENPDYCNVLVDCENIYADGFSHWNDANGSAHFDILNPRITRLGLEFLKRMDS